MHGDQKFFANSLFVSCENRVKTMDDGFGIRRFTESRRRKREDKRNVQYAILLWRSHISYYAIDQEWFVDLWECSCIEQLGKDPSTAVHSSFVQVGLAAQSTWSASEAPYDIWKFTFISPHSRFLFRIKEEKSYIAINSTIDSFKWALVDRVRRDVASIELGFSSCIKDTPGSSFAKELKATNRE